MDTPSLNGAAQADEALRRSEARYRALAEASSQAVWCWSPDGGTGDFSAAQRWWERLTGQTPEEQGDNTTGWLAVVNPDDREAAGSAWGDSIATGAPYDVEYRVRSRAGGWRHVRARGVPVRGAGGAIVEWVGTLDDVTEWRASEEAARLSEVRFRELFEQAPLSIQVLAPDGRTLRVNRAWERLWGLTLGQLADYNVLEDPQLEAKGVAPYLRRAAAGEAVVIPAIQYDPEETIPGRTSHQDPRRWVSAVAYPLRDAAGRVHEVVLIHQDETVRHLADEAVRRNEAWLQTVTDSLPALVSYVGRDLRYRFVNRAYEEWFGVSAADVLGKAISDVLGEEGFNLRRASVEAALAGEPVRFEAPTLHRGLGARVTEVTYTPHREGGEVVGFFVHVHDVSERKQTEDALRHSEERLRLALDAGRLGVWDWDVVTGRITWSDRVHEFYGMRPGEFDGTLETFARHLHPEDAGRAREAIRASVEDGAPYRIEYRIVQKGGDVRWIYTSGDVVRDAGGAPLRMIGATMDVTDRKRAEDDLARVTAESERRRRLYETILSSTPDLVYVFGLDHRFTYANEILLEMWGRTWEEAIGKNCLELGYERWHAEMHDREIEQVVATKGPVRGEVPFTGTFGRRIYDYIFVPVIGADGEVEAVAGTTRDVTERKAMEDELRDNDRKKDDFIALLAHELRNPLAPIRNGLQVIRLSDDREVRRGAQGMMERQLAHMVRLIDDLLDVSRISRNKMELRRSRLTLAEAVYGAVETARPAVEEGGHELTVSLPQRPVYLDADLTRLAQVFGNLLTNSAKYTPRGGRIWLTAEPRGGEVVVSVRDDGIGIPAGSLANIFDMFSQVDRSIERSTGGLGIGLALVKGLVEMHGGTVTAESGGEGKGSTFTVTLPVLGGHGEAASNTPDRAAQGRPGRRVLVVDDNRDGAESLAMMLRLMGDEVETANDGVGAVERAESFRPDVILMDVGMPRLNGLEATRRIRAQPWGTMTIIAITGWGQENDRQRSREAGCDGHLVKPVNLPDLERMLEAEA